MSEIPAERINEIDERDRQLMQRVNNISLYSKIAIFVAVASVVVIFVVYFIQKDANVFYYLILSIVVAIPAIVIYRKNKKTLDYYTYMLDRKDNGFVLTLEQIQRDNYLSSMEPTKLQQHLNKQYTTYYNTWYGTGPDQGAGLLRFDSPIL